MPTIRSLIAAMVIVAFAPSAVATMIIVVYAKDGVWIGADSYRSEGEKHITNVCKIHETRFGLLVKSGDSKGITEGGMYYSTDKEIEDLLSRANDLISFERDVRDTYESDIEDELVFITDDPKVTSRDLRVLKMASPIPDQIIHQLTRSLLLFNTADRGGTGLILQVIPENKPLLALDHRRYMYHARTVLLWRPIQELHARPELSLSLPPSIRQFDYAVPFAKADAWVMEHPREAIEEMFQLAHKQQPEHIGPPYAVVHVLLSEDNVPKIEWVNRGVCPSWSDAAPSGPTALDVREEGRKLNILP